MLRKRYKSKDTDRGGGFIAPMVGTFQMRVI